MFAVSAWPHDVERRFGGKQGLLRHSAARVAGLLGAWRPFAALELGRAARFVFVCQGNVCRSAYAAARAEQLGLPSTSFGLGAFSGDPAHPQAVAAAERRGVDLRAHRARSRIDVALEPTDMVLAMEPRQAFALCPMLPPLAQLTVLGLWAPSPRPHLEDPYGLCDAYFDTCFGIIDAALARLAKLWSDR